MYLNLTTNIIPVSEKRKEEFMHKAVDVIWRIENSREDLFRRLRKGYNNEKEWNDVFYNMSNVGLYCLPESQVKLILRSVPSVFPYDFDPHKKLAYGQKRRAIKIASLGSSGSINNFEIAKVIGAARRYLIGSLLESYSRDNHFAEFHSLNC